MAVTSAQPASTSAATAVEPVHRSRPVNRRESNAAVFGPADRTAHAPYPVFGATQRGAPAGSGDRRDAAAGRSTSQIKRPPDIQRACSACDTEERAQPARAARDGAGPAGPRQQASLDVLRGHGRPLAPRVREYFEPRFGRDFEHVRIHTGPRADSAARAFRARAFTLGRDIVFASGEYTPESTAGRRLVAHELTHTIQQAGAGPAVQRVTTARPFPLSDAEEDQHDPDAMRVLERAFAGGSTTQNGAAGFHAPVGVTEFALNTPAGANPRYFTSAVDGALHLGLPVLRGEESGPAFADLADAVLDSVRDETRSLVRGDRGRAVDIVQRALGFWGAAQIPVVDLPASGEFDAATESAVRTFQSTTTIGTTGVMDAVTLATMQSMPPPAIVRHTIEDLPSNNITGIIRIPAPPASWQPLSYTAKELVVLLNHHGFTPRSGFDICTTGNSKRELSLEVTTDLVRDVTDHERQHEADDEAMANATIQPWEDAVEALRDDGFMVSAPNVATAAPLLYDAIRARSARQEGTPCEMGVAMETRIVDDANALHGQAGGNIRVQDFNPNSPFCRNVKVTWGQFPGAPAFNPATPDVDCLVSPVPTVRI